MLRVCATGAPRPRAPRLGARVCLLSAGLCPLSEKPQVKPKAPHPETPKPKQLKLQNSPVPTPQEDEEKSAAAQKARQLTRKRRFEPYCGPQGRHTAAAQDALTHAPDYRCLDAWRSQLSRFIPPAVECIHSP